MTAATLSDLLHLGGHGLYVCSAYAFTFGALLLEALLARRRARRAAQALREPAP